MKKIIEILLKTISVFGAWIKKDWGFLIIMIILVMQGFFGRIYEQINLALENGDYLKVVVLYFWIGLLIYRCCQSCYYLKEVYKEWTYPYNINATPYTVDELFNDLNDYQSVSVAIYTKKKYWGIGVPYIHVEVWDNLIDPNTNKFMHKRKYYDLGEDMYLYHNICDKLEKKDNRRKVVIDEHCITFFAKYPYNENGIH